MGWTPSTSDATDVYVSSMDMICTLDTGAAGIMVQEVAEQHFATYPSDQVIDEIEPGLKGMSVGPSPLPRLDLPLREA